MKVDFNENAKVEFVNQFLKSKIDVEFDESKGNIDIAVTQKGSEFWLKTNVEFCDAAKMMSKIKPDYCVGEKSFEIDYYSFHLLSLIDAIKNYQSEFISKITEFEVCFR